jgi:acetyl esterase/lipase
VPTVGRYTALLIAVVAAFVGARNATAAPRVERDIAYAFSVNGADARRRQSFDLYLPESSKPAPLVVFIHGGFWAESDDAYGFGKRVADALAADGAAVALVRYRLSPAVKHPTHVRDVAAALAALKRLAGRYGYDAKRIYLIGHSAGATIAAQLVLDAAYLNEVDMRPADLSGVVLLSGIYDLGPSGPMEGQFAPFARAAFGTQTAALRAASPITHAGRGPPMLVLCGENDLERLAIDARRFVKALRAAGQTKVRNVIIPKRDHFGIVDLGKAPLVRALIDDMIGLKPLDTASAELLRLGDRWVNPPFSSEPFAHAGVPVRSFPVNKRFFEALRAIFEYNSYELSAYPLKEFRAVDLLAYLDAQPRERVGHGEYLIITNVCGERLYFSRSDLVATRPVIVIGLDDESNLFRLNVFYRNQLEYSWQPQKPPIMARPVGAFLYFLKAPPPRIGPSTRSGYALTPNSFRLVPTNPFASIADAPVAVREVLVRSNACLNCHSFRGIGAHAGHITGADGKLHGGFALPLESYSPAVWHQFMFDQATSARLIGVKPNPVEGPAAQALYDVVVAERSRRDKPNK